MILLPRLPGPAAERLLGGFLEAPSEWTGFDPANLPEAVRFAATGGSRVRSRELRSLRDGVEKGARASGFGTDGGTPLHARFDADLAAWLTDAPLFDSGEALRDDFWAFVGVAVAPDIVHWRFRATRERYLGGVRNTFQRLWLRGRALDRGAQHPKRWHLLDELSEDALVQIAERPSIGGDPVLSRALAEGWVRTAANHGKPAMEPIMRRAVMRVRIWNEIRNLACLPADTLNTVVDEAFALAVEGGDWEPAVADETGRKGVSVEPTDAEAAATPHQSAGASRGTPEDLSLATVEAAKRILAEATKRRLVSPKSRSALEVFQKRSLDLKPSQRNALLHLLTRFRSAEVLEDDVTLVEQMIPSRTGADTAQ